MILQNSTDIKTEIFYDENKDPAPVDVRYEKHIVNPNGLIQLQNIPSPLHTVFDIRGKDGVTVIKYNKVEVISNKYDFTVDYINGILTFHNSQKGKEVQISYTNSIGRLSISADRIFTGIDNQGNVIQTLGTLLEEGRQTLSDLEVLGGATKVITEIEGYIESIKQLTGNIVEGENVNTELKKSTDTAKSTNTTLNSTINNANNQIDEMNSWVESHSDIVNLDNRVDTAEIKLDTTITQLEERAKSLAKINTSIDSNKQSNGCVTFIDDDGVLEVNTLLKPVFEKYNKKFCIAIPTDKIGTSGYLNWQEVRELRDIGINILSHAKSHNTLADMTPEQQEYELSQSKIDALNNGILLNDIVYPGNRPGDAKKYVLKYYRSGIGLNGSTYNMTPLVTREVQRVELGSWQSKSNEELKALINTAKANGKWIIFMTHCSVTGTNEHPNGNIANIEEILKYCCDSNVDVLTYDEAYRKHCNVWENGDWGLTNTNYVVMGNDYIVRSYNKDFQNSINRIKYKDDILPTLHPNNISIDENIIYTKIDTATAIANALPLNSPGLLVTHKFGTGSFVGYTKQYYLLHNSFKRFYRYCGDNGAWSDWKADIPFDWMCQSVDYDNSCNMQCLSTINASGKSLIFITTPADEGTSNIIANITASKAGQRLTLINQLGVSITVRNGTGNLFLKSDGDFTLKTDKAMSFIHKSGKWYEI